MMKRATYLPPTVKVVQFYVEAGFAGSNEPVGLTFSRGSKCTTGETYTEYTDNNGEFFSGRW